MGGKEEARGLKEMIRLADVTTGYRRKVVTRGIDAAICGGELTCLLGPNGAGKSTLLKTLSGFIPPLSGEIFVGDKSLKTIGARELARTMGVVLTERPSTINMTVEELVGLGRNPYTSFWGGLREDDRAVVKEAIELVGIGELSGRSVDTLSDGERQKTLIAKALAQQTEVIFLDEPTAFLDYPSKVEILKLLHRLAHEEGKTIFLSTHDVDLSLQIADKVWLLDKRLGLTIGSPRELGDTGRLAAYFETSNLLYNPDRRQFTIR